MQTNLFPALAMLALAATSASGDDFTPAPRDYEYLTVTEDQRAHTAENVETLRQIFEEAIFPGNWTRMRELYADNYVQHSPDMEDGVDGVIKLFSSIDPGNGFVYENFMNIAEGPYVVAVSRLRFNAESPLLAVIDINFIAEGKSREHWDIMMPVEDAGKFFSISRDPAPRDQATMDANKALAAEFVNTVFNRGEAERGRDFIGDVYVQHGMGGDSADSVVEVASTVLRGASIDIKRIIAQDDLVLMHARVSLNGQDFARADIWRVTDGKFSEHWGFMQPVPDHMPHRNGMF